MVAPKHRPELGPRPEPVTSTVKSLAERVRVEHPARGAGLDALYQVGPPPGRLPWGLEDLRRLVMTLGIGVAAVAASWLGTSGTTSYTRQVHWVVLGVAGIIVEGAGIAMWLLSGMRLVRQRQAELKYRVRANVLSRGSAPSRPSEVESVSKAGTVRFVSGRDMTRFHLPDCPLVRGKVAQAATRSAHERAGRQPCGVCLR